MSSPSTKNEEHSIKSGETLSGIASQHGISLETLLAANPEIASGRTDCCARPA